MDKRTGIQAMLQDKESAVELLLRMNPLLAIVNYLTVFALLYFLVQAYIAKDIADAITAIVYVVGTRFILVSLLRWRTRKRYDSMLGDQN